MAPIAQLTIIFKCHGAVIIETVFVYIMIFKRIYIAIVSRYMYSPIIRPEKELMFVSY